MLVLITVALAGVAVLAAIVVVAVGGGGELSVEHPDHPPLALPGRRAIGGTDAALLRLPLGLWGYHKQITDEALERFAYELTERDTRIAVLEQELAEVRHGRGVGPRALPAPAPRGDVPSLGPAPATLADHPSGTYVPPGTVTDDAPEPYSGPPEARVATEETPATPPDAEGPWRTVADERDGEHTREHEADERDGETDIGGRDADQPDADQPEIGEPDAAAEPEGEAGARHAARKDGGE